MLARAVWLLLMLLLTSSGFLPASMRPDCGGVLLPTVTYNTLRYALLMTNSVNGTKCSWILQAASTETLELEVISYQTVSWTDASCTSTYLAIKLGPTQKERRFCDPFQSIPEVGRKLLFRGKGTAVVTLQSAYGMKQGFALRYSVLVPDPSRREIDARALELQTMSPLPSAENEQVDLSQREAGMYSTPTGQGQLIISQYPRTSNVQERQGSPWIHQVSWYPRRPKLSGILSGKRQRTQTQSQPREIPTRRNSKSDSRTKFHPKSLGCQTSKEKPKISPSLASLKVVAVSESNTRRHPYLTSIIQLLSSSTSSPRSHIPSSPSVYTSPPSLSSPSVYTSPPSSSSPSVYNSPLSSSSPNVYTSPPSPSSSSPSVYTSPPSPSSPSVYISSPFPSPSPSSPSVYTSPPSPSSPSVYISSPSPSNPSVYTSSPSHSSLGPIPPGLGPSALSPSGLSPTPSDLSLRTISRSGLRWIAPSPSSLGPSTRSPFGPGWSSPSIPYRSTPTQSILISSSPSPSSPAPRSLSVTSPLTFRSNLTSTLLLSPHLPFSSLPPDNIFENLSGPSSTSPQEDQENVMSQSRPRLSNQPVVDLSEGVWGLSPGSFTESNSGLWPLTSTGTVDPTKINMSQEGVDTTSDANTNLVITSGGEPNVLPKISGELLTSISPRTVQKSTNQSVSRRTEPPGMESEMSLVPVSVPGDEDYHHQWRSRQQDHSSERGLALSAGNEVDPVTQSELQDEVKIPVTLTPAHEFSSPLSVLQGVVEMSRGSGSVSRVERSSTASDTAQSESQSQNSVPSLPASPGELITPQPDQDRKQESESDQHLLSFSQPADLPTSELLSTQNINTQSLVNSLKIDSVAGSMNPLENTHSTLDFKGSSSDFDGSFTQTFGPVVIKPTSRAWNMFEIPELMTHSSNLPGQEVANDAETDTAAMISESGPTARLPEIVSAVSSLSGADTTQRARPLSAVTGDNDLMSTNKFPRSFSFTSGISLTAISDVASGGEIVSSEVTGGGGDVTGWESETLTVRDTTIKDDGNVTQFTFTKDRMTKESANHSQRLEVTQRAENNTGFWVISGISVAKKDSGRGNTLRDSATEMMARTKPSEKTLWFERRTILPPNVGGENTGSSPTGHNVVSRDKVPLFNLRTPAPESITSQTVANVSSLFIGDDHSASPSREIFPTLSLSELPEQSSTSFEEPLPLTSVRETIASTSSNTTVSRGNTMSFPCSKLEPQMSDGERLRETSATAMNQTFQEGTVLNKPVVTSGTPTLIQGSWSEMQLDSRATASPALPGLTSSVVTVTDVPQLLPFVSTFETAPRLSSDQTGTGHSQILSSPSETSGVSDLRETAWQNIMNLKATPPSPPAFPSAAEEEEAIATGVGSPSSWALQMNQSGSQPVDGSLGPSVTHVDTKDLKRDAAQTVKPWANEWWQKEILSTFATEHFWTWSWFDLGTSSISHGVAPTSGSSAPPEGTTPHPAVTMIPRSVTTFKDPIAVTPGSDNSWTSGRDGPSLFSPTLGTGTSMSPVPTSWPLHLPIDTTPPERAVQTATQQYTPATLGELSNSVLSFTPMERHKSIFIVENELPMIKEGATLKIPTKLILAMNFTLQLGDPTSDEYQNLAKDFTHKVSPFYKKVPGFQQLLIKHFRAGSVLIEFDVVFIAKDIRGYLLDPSSIINITGLNDVIADGFEIGGAQVLRVYVSEGFIALCGQVFSCQTGFQCIHTDRRNVTCTSLCHTDYCKNSGICTHTRGQEPMCQCPVGMDYWFMGPRCDHRMTRQSLIGIVFGVILSVLLVMTAVAVVVLRRFKILLIEAKIDQTKSSYKRFSQFDDFSSQYHSQSWLNYSVSSLNNPGFSNSDELVHLQMLDSSYHSCHEESLTGIHSSWRTTPHGHFRHSLQNNLDISINSINELAGDSGKDSDLSIYSWPTDPLQWSPFPILYQLSRDKPFTAQRPRSYCEGMELVSLEKNWTA